MRKWTSFLSGLIFGVPLFGGASFSFASDEVHDTRIGIWSAKAVSLGEPFNKTADVSSPDLRSKLVETEDGLIFVGRNTVLLREIISFPQLTEVLWAPNSRLFVVTGSDGGAVGTWHAVLYSINERDLIGTKDLRSLLHSWVHHPSQCKDEDANYGAVSWLSDSNHLLVVREIPPHSSCKEMGRLTGFVINVSKWKIVEKLPENRLRARWGDLVGSRLKN